MLNRRSWLWIHRATSLQGYHPSLRLMDSADNACFTVTLVDGENPLVMTLQCRQHGSLMSIGRDLSPRFL